MPSDTQERQDRVWALFIRGIAPERIAAELSLDAAQVASWLAERLTVDDAADQRVAAGEALRVLKRSLFADLERVEPARKPAFATAIANIEQKIVAIDGRCGARLRGKPGVYCKRFPEPRRSRCRLHGGASPVGRDHPSFKHGGRSGYPIVLSPREQVKYEEFMAEQYTLAEQVALAKVQYARAVAAGSSGTAELNALAGAIRAHLEVTKGKTIHIRFDEPLARQAINLVLDVVVAAVTPEQLERIQAGLRQVDIKSVTAGVAH
ncbi:MAG TPA: hypothetical protein DCK98_13555 [Chloroflexi bacterium]|nr:hypothetical protein [Chloroflexota bacterium]HAL27869.1 hypothetical protein [Chloroflexota bacterium]